MGLAKRLINAGRGEIADTLSKTAEQAAKNGAKVFVIKLIMSAVVPAAARKAVDLMDGLLDKVEEMINDCAGKIQVDPEYREAVILLASSLDTLKDRINEILENALVEIQMNNSDFQTIKNTINDPTIAIDVPVGYDEDVIQ